ncbi:MAG: selenide, water dikinase SelD [Flavobacteriales bacterium]|nr:selenide, water dikinase SelD [Flavobacteriales bacterium]
MNNEPDGPIRLTRFSHGAGCGCKIAPALLEEILHGEVATLTDPALLVGYGSRDDAAVYSIGDGRCLISTTDFFPPIVDDPFDYGRIAATNALSDIYAMGGRPLLAVAILGWPIEKLGPEPARKVLDGGRTACAEAGIALAGGHSIDAPEPFFGLAVTGEVAERHVKRNDTARVGDLLYLTKPIGVGILSTAMKRGILPKGSERTLVDTMTRINSVGTTLGTMDAVHAMTDITGFGLSGHLLEMCGTNLSAELVFDAIPVLPEVLQLIAQGCYPDGALRNWKSHGHLVQGADSMERMFVIADPQTSGGLLIACDPTHSHDLEQVLLEHGLPGQRIGTMTRIGPHPLVFVR